ncbi:hypothetical protein PR048_022294 [Dryococelus australis]|uniref:Uncharacterized protein n=1 Tax=Dryococelus australis TaxID=614101 RepID=A0ABQ9H0N3_9NEOP|nr:hypothetical protein PR048_022294 [Dryococelus australis]
MQRGGSTDGVVYRAVVEDREYPEKTTHTKAFTRVVSGLSTALCSASTVGAYVKQQAVEHPCVVSVEHVRGDPLRPCLLDRRGRPCNLCSAWEGTDSVNSCSHIVSHGNVTPRYLLVGGRELLSSSTPGRCDIHYTMMTASVNIRVLKDCFFRPSFHLAVENAEEMHSSNPALLTAMASEPLEKLSCARLHHRGSKLAPRSDLRSTQKTVAPFEFRAGLEIEMEFISNRRNCDARKCVVKPLLVQLHEVDAAPAITATFTWSNVSHNLSNKETRHSKMDYIAFPSEAREKYNYKPIVKSVGFDRTVKPAQRRKRYKPVKRLSRRGDEPLGTRASVARIAPSLQRLEHAKQARHTQGPLQRGLKSRRRCSEVQMEQRATSATCPTAASGMEPGTQWWETRNLNNAPSLLPAPGLLLQQPASRESLLQLPKSNQLRAANVSRLACAGRSAISCPRALIIRKQVMDWTWAWPWSTAPVNVEMFTRLSLTACPGTYLLASQPVDLAITNQELATACIRKPSQRSPGAISANHRKLYHREANPDFSKYKTRVLPRSVTFSTWPAEYQSHLVTPTIVSYQGNAEFTTRLLSVDISPARRLRTRESPASSRATPGSKQKRNYASYRLVQSGILATVAGSMCGCPGPDLILDFCGFPQSLQANAGMVTYHRPWPIPTCPLISEQLVPSLITSLSTTYLPKGCSRQMVETRRAGEDVEYPPTRDAAPVTSWTDSRDDGSTSAGYGCEGLSDDAEEYPEGRTSAGKASGKVEATVNGLWPKMSASTVHPDPGAGSPHREHAGTCGPPPRASEDGHSRLIWSSAEVNGREKRGIPERSRRPAASSGTIPTCEDPGAVPPGIGPGLGWCEAGDLTTTPPRPLRPGGADICLYNNAMFVSLVFVQLDHSELESDGDELGEALLSSRSLRGVTFAQRGKRTTHESSAFAWSDFGRPSKPEIRTVEPGSEPGPAQCVTAAPPHSVCYRLLTFRVIATPNTCSRHIRGDFESVLVLRYVSLPHPVRASEEEDRESLYDSGGSTSDGGRASVTKCEST